MIFHTRHHHSVADRLSSKNLVRVEYQLQGFHGNQATTSPYLLPINDVGLISVLQYICLISLYMGSPFMRSISSLGTTRHTESKCI